MPLIQKPPSSNDPLIVIGPARPILRQLPPMIPEHTYDWDCLLIMYTGLFINYVYLSPHISNSSSIRFLIKQIYVWEGWLEMQTSSSDINYISFLWPPPLLISLFVY
jgi:hypothetical protein